MRRIFPILFLALLAASAHAAADRIPAPVRDHVTRLVDEGRVMGLVVGVVDESGSSTFSRGRLASGGAPVDEATIFEIGSISKVFTAALLAEMALRGEVELDEPVARLLPATAKMPLAGEAITLVDLATHRSGLPRLPDPFDPADAQNPYAAYSEEDLLRSLASHRLEREVGSRYEYSNLGAGLLGYALARRAERSYEALVVDRLAGPLGMVDTRVTLSPDQELRLARGHLGRQQVAGWDFDALAGAGALRSTARDLLRFLAAHLGFAGDDTPVPALAATHGARHETGVPDLAVALGWHVWSKFGTEILCHSGGTGGYRSFVGFDPAHKRGVVVLANTVEQIDGIGLHLLEPRFALGAVRSMTVVDQAELAQLDGFYELQPGVVIEITHEGEQLFAQLTGQERLPVYPESASVFYSKVVDARLSFVRGEDGVVERLILHQGGDHPAPRISDYQPPVHVEVPIDPALLVRYLGKYELAPGILFDVALQDGRLAIRLADQPRLAVFPKSDTRFFYEAVEAEITFVVDETGTVTGLVLHQAGMEQRAAKVE
jgi:CubicO group peptidase (beta-lactamase class C family)